MIAAEEDVLAVVDPLSRDRVVERGRASAEAAARLEHQHAGTTLDQRRGRAQAGEAGTDDDDVRRLRVHASETRRPASVAAQMRRAIRSRRDRGTRIRAENTSYPAASMRTRMP